jgi:uncharacterized protein (TIGR03437 family)
MLYVSPLRMNFLVPSGVSAGPATATIASKNGTSTLVHSAQIETAPVAPAIFRARIERRNADLRACLHNAENGALVANPIGLGSATDQVYLSLFGTGIRAAADGVPVSIQGENVPVVYAGAQPDFGGLDQINVLLPHSLVGSGLVTIVVTANHIPANEVTYDRVNARLQAAAPEPWCPGECSVAVIPVFC